MRPLLLALVGISLLLGQSPGPSGLTGAAATGSVGPQAMVQASGNPASNSVATRAKEIKGGTQTQRELQSAVFVGAVVANVAAASVQ